MAYAVLMRLRGTDGSKASNWWPDFSVGDTVARRAMLTAKAPAEYELVKLDEAGYRAAEELVYGPLRVSLALAQAADDTTWATIKTKVLSFFGATLDATELAILKKRLLDR